MSNFGIPYMGSKSKIASEIIAFLPKGKRLVDLFGGGMAITECGMYSKKWEKYLYNELNPLVVELVKKAINGDYNYNKFKPTFITPEEFKSKYNQDGYIKYIWSFSNQGEQYMFGKNVYKIKEQGHNYCIFDKPIEGLNIPVIKGTPHQKRMFLKKWCQATFEKEWKRATPRIKSDYKKYQDIMNGTSKSGKKLALKFTSWLRTTGITAKEIKELTNSDMASHYLTTGSQPAIPTDEMWKLMKKSSKLKNISHEIELICNSEERIKRLQQLEQLEQLERLQRLEITNKSYLDYEYEEGDIVYCDPPYEGTANYNESSFNHKEFYDWVASRPYPVYFSSYKISDDRFKVVWACEKRSLMNGARTTAYNYERIYTQK